jgi:hypothetical protein
MRQHVPKHYTRRELAIVLTGFAEGLTNAEIAQRLWAAGFRRRACSVFGLRCEYGAPTSPREPKRQRLRTPRQRPTPDEHFQAAMRRAGYAHTRASMDETYSLARVVPAAPGYVPGASNLV